MTIIVSLISSLIHEIVAEIPILQMQLVPEDREGLESFTSQQSSIIASLSLIGGFDSRPRLGGLVTLDSGFKGVISRIDSRGKIFAQMLDSNETKKVALTAILNSRPEPRTNFHLEKFLLHEDSVRVATSLFNLLSQDFKIDKDKWKIVTDNSSDCINMALLRQQQLRLSIIKAVQVFFTNQNVLRHILKQPLTFVNSNLETSESSEAMASSGLKKEASLLQRLLSKATHPSPIRAVFNLDELEAASLAVCQYLASAAAAKRNNSSGGFPQPQQPQKEATPSLASTILETGEFIPPAANRSVTAKDLKRRSNKKQQPQPPRSQSPPPTGNVQTLMEMGFPRKAVEQACKALGGLGNMNPSPESIVGWLLEHQDQVDLDMTSSSLRTAEEDSEINNETSENSGDESDTDSVSDSFEDIDASGASEAFANGNVTNAIPMPEIYKKRSDFVTNDDYALYVRTHVQAGMTVKCCRTYEEVHEGDVGKVVKVSVI